MKNLKKRLDFALIILKILGGLPTVKCSVVKVSAMNTNSCSKSTAEQICSVQESPCRPSITRCCLWKMIAVVVNFSFVIYLSTLLWSLYDRFQHLDKRQETYTAVDSIEDLCNMSAILIIGIYLKANKSTADDIVNKFHYLLQKVLYDNEDGIFSYELEVYLLLYSTGWMFGNVSILIVLSESQSLTRLNEIFETLFNYPFFCFTISFYLVSILLLCALYANIENRMMQMRPKEMIALDRKNVSRLRSGSNENFTEELEAHLKVLADTEALLTELHEFHRLVHEYMGLPVSVVMFISVYSCIFSSFFLFAYLVKKGLMISVFESGNLLAALVSILALTNAPVKVNRKINDLKMLTNTLRRHPSFSHLRSKLDDLKELLDETPGFELCHIFTIGRPRILDIFSYVATYMVILLQFKITEGGSNIVP